MGNDFLKMNLPRLPLLADKEVKSLLALAQKGDSFAKDKLVNYNLRLVFNLVRRFQNRGYDLEELFQIGCIGLIKAIDKFDLSYEVKFSTYAVPMIIGEIKRFLRDNTPIKVSRSLKEINYKIQQAREKLTVELGREPSLKEISVNLDLPLEDLVVALEASMAPASIHENLYQDEGESIYLEEQLKGSDDVGDSPFWLDMLLVGELMEKLSFREQKIISWRFLEDRTQKDIAKDLGLSQVQISRLEKQALQKIRDMLKKKEDK